MNTRGNNGLVVGPQGSNVKRIEDETGARVKCLKDKTTVEIYGSPEAVRRATDKIIDLLEAKSGGSRDRPGEKRRRDDDRFGDDNKRPRGAQNDSLLDYLRSSAVELGVSKEFPPDFVDESNADEQGNVEETASITNYVGLIIGKQGRMHSEIQRIVDIPMTINKEDETVTFKGPAANVGRGLALIREVIELTNAVRDARNATRERDDVEETISITGDVGAVVGKQGNTVKRIKSQLPRCLFQVDRNSETVLVRGAPEMVELAKRLVSEAIENVQARARERGGDVDADMGGEAPMEQDRDLRERLG
jgi:rRNA processing protein Krr1/Pno1